MPQDDELTRQRADFVAYQRRRDARLFLQSLTGADLSGLQIPADASKNAIQLALDTLDTGHVLTSEITSVLPPTVEEVKRLTVASLTTLVVLQRFDITVGLDERYMYLVAEGEGPIADRISVFQIQGDVISGASSLFPVPNVLPEELTAIFQQQMMVSEIRRTSYYLSPPVAPLYPSDSPRRSVK